METPTEQRAETFPIQGGLPVPMACAERAYQTYAKLFGRSQTLQRLGERGGFGRQEFACLFMGHEPERGHQACIDASDAVGRRLAALEARAEGLLTLLRSVEWNATVYDGAHDVAGCPACFRPKRSTSTREVEGHAPDCPLAAALAGKEVQGG